MQSPMGIFRQCWMTVALKEIKAGHDIHRRRRRSVLKSRCSALLRPSLSPRSAASLRSLAPASILAFRPKHLSHLGSSYVLFGLRRPNKWRSRLDEKPAASGSSGMRSCPCAELPGLTITRNAAECQAAQPAHRPITALGE